MKIISGPKGSGKTEELIVWLLEGHLNNKSRYLIVRDEATKIRLVQLLQKLWTETGNPTYVNNAANCIITIEQCRKRAFGLTPETEYAVDDVDGVLRDVLRLHRPPSIASTTDPVQGPTAGG